MVIAFTRQLYVLMKAGIPLLKALQIIYAQLPDGKFKENIELVISDIQEGKSFSESLSFSPKFFSLFYINMIKTSEVSGNLVGTLKELSQHLIQNRRISRQVQSAFMYPAFILIITIVILAALLMVVLPTFTRIFADFGGKLPTITLLLIGLSEFTVRWGWLFLLFLIVAAGAISLLYRKTTGTDNVKDTHIDWGTLAGQVSSDDVTEGTANKYATLANVNAFEADPIVKAISGIIKSNGTAISAATPGTDYIASETDPSALKTAGTDNVKDTHIDWGTRVNAFFS